MKKFLLLACATIVLSACEKAVLPEDDLLSEETESTAQIPAGQYTLYAIGGDDLTRFDLPSQEEATPTSVITRLSGKIMTDLMMATAYLDVAEGETLNRK